MLRHSLALVATVHTLLNDAAILTAALVARTGGSAEDVASARGAWSFCRFLVVDGPEPRVEAVQSIVRLAIDSKCEVDLWMMGANCSAHQGGSGMTCSEHADLGGVAGAAARYVAESYEALPERLILASSALSAQLVKMDMHLMATTKYMKHFACRESLRVADDAGFNLRCYRGTDLAPAAPYGLLNWALAHVERDPEAVRGRLECAGGAWRTSKDLLLQRPRAFYEGLRDLLEVSQAPEAGHYVERLAGLVFGGTSPPPDSQGPPTLALRKAEGAAARLLDEPGAFEDATRGHHDASKACSVAIAAPYRGQAGNDREQQLDAFEAHMVGFMADLRKEHPSCAVRLVIVEQSEDGRRFNRGYLSNVGFDLAKKRIPDMSTFILHDIDLLPSDPGPYAVVPKPGSYLHLAHVLSKYPYDSFVGGVFSVSPETYEKVNGFPNTCWGWGNEDDELGLRLEENHVTIVRSCQGSYNDTDQMNIGEAYKHGFSPEIAAQVNPDKIDSGFSRPEAVDKHWREDGISSLKYDIKEAKHTGKADVLHFVVQLAEKVKAATGWPDPPSLPRQSNGWPALPRLN